MSIWPRLALASVSLTVTLCGPASAAPPVGAAPLSTVSSYTSPVLDRGAALAAYPRSRDPAPLRFAEEDLVSMTPADSGSWETLPDGTRLWRLHIQAPGALSVNLGFDHYWMPPGARLSLYSPDTDQVRGVYGAEHNHRGQLWTPLIQGENLVVMVTVPAAEADAVVLRLSQINRGFRGLVAVEKSGSCNVDVVCPQGDPWAAQIRSVAAYSASGVFTCSGALVNNTANDGRPYFLTAHHCGTADSGVAATVVMYWNYQNSTCRTPGSGASGGAGDGSLDQTTMGASLRATYADSDFTLLELDTTPDPAYNVHWAGWDARDITSLDAVVAIHHPSVQEKRISFEDDATTITTYGSDSPDNDGTHIRVEDWDLGTTEGGSSGSPLFDPQGRIVGQLHGGFAACGNEQPDWYGRLAVSWEGGGSSASRLRNWLDPVGNGTTLLLDGMDASGSALPFGDGFED